ncbi:MAG: radical SAM protein [Allosphingosinicella sp.]
MGPTAGGAAVVQIHPTLRCNLACAHCYSTSSPQRREALDAGVLEQFLAEARAEGYDAVGFSGGEPLVYRPLPRLLQTARGLGLKVTVTTNGLLLDDARLGAIAPHLSLLAISLDGAPASHDRMRGRVGAFEQMQRRLGQVRAAGVPFGFIFTLTLANLHELGWAAEFAAAEGAALLQVHPLESAGRAIETRLEPPDELELSYAFLEVARLQKQYGERLAIQYDVLDRAAVRCDPGKAFAVAAPAAAELASAPLAHWLSSIVIQADGWIVPLQYGFSTDFAIGRVGAGDFRRQASGWLRDRYGPFLALARDVWDVMAESPAHLPFANWYARMSEASHRPNVPSVAVPAPEMARAGLQPSIPRA